MKYSKTNFRDSHWANNEFAHEYLKDNDIFIPQRMQVLQLIKIIFSFYIDEKIQKPYIIDLGCGDGAITKALIDIKKNLISTLIDGSEHMLESAINNIPSTNIKEAVNITFQDLYDSSFVKGEADFVVSSLAIHHLNKNEKSLLYKYVYTKLKKGGMFINYDPVLSPSEELDKLNLKIWKEWILNLETKIHPKRDKSLDYIPMQYKNNKDNIPGTLDSQLEMLRQAGFLDVNLFYKYGLFCLFGGRK